MQRFSGTGVAPRERVQQQERRARVTTLLLAAIAVLVIACSALLLFNPFLQHPGFGFDPGHRFVREDSNVPLIVEGTAPPTATPSSSTTNSTPTATPHTAGQPTSTPAASGTRTPSASATATRAPTATVGPTATPKPTSTSTPVPTVTATAAPAPTATTPASAAVVKFTATQKTVSFSSPMTSCPSGCSVASYSTGTHYETWYSNYWNYDQYSQTVLKGQISVTNENNNPFNGQIWATLRNNSLFGCWTPTVSLLRAGVNPAPVTIECDFNYGDSLVSSIPARAVCCSALEYNNSTGGDNTISYINNNAYTSYGNWNLSSGRCGSAETQAQQVATNAENTWLTSQMSGSGRQEVNRAIWGPNWQLCTPNGQTFASKNSPPTTRGEAQMNGHALGFSPSQAQGFAQSQLGLPSGYYWTAGATGCSSLTWSGVNANDYNATFSITCPVSRHADYDWRSSSTTGQQAQNALIGKIASQPVKPVTKSQAISTCEATAGVAGTCTITIQGGDGQTMPESGITIQATEP